MSVEYDSVDSVVYIDDSAEVAKATVTFHRAELRQSVDLKDWVQSKHMELYPGRYVCSNLAHVFPRIYLIFATQSCVGFYGHCQVSCCLTIALMAT